ncbi:MULTISPECIES: PAS domain-containing protein [Halolamina]|uniref:histidine kinase n=1 Tax=Halolamina pelagica TaxID=699431 RepID=A0A1I5NVL7_9EURY|nr:MULTISPECIES: PAS domain-containing protein [Halolamina]NHX36502.1 PAS domain-containing protein [Halolamina sp. R1-12]SFP25835.1 PAS domain S-box-containing protein [Halolamina pelagica]
MSESGQQARRDLYELLRSENTFEQKARGALELGRRYLDADNGHLTQIDQQTGHWEAIVSTDGPGGDFPPGLELDLGTTYCRRTIEADAPIAVSEAPNQGWADDPAFQQHGLHCYHGTKLILDGKPYGTVCFVAENPRKEQFSEDETMFAELIAQMLERELERERHEAQLHQQTNLAVVLNRVLRHNLRNGMTVIRGYTQLVGGKRDNDTMRQMALQKIDSILELSEKARQLSSVIAVDQEREPADIVSLVRDCVNSVEQSYPNANVTIAAEQEAQASILTSFGRAVEELIENAAKHGSDSPTVTVTVETVPKAVEIRITDDGPGLSRDEADVLETGEETPLKHGSGLGLWLAHWIVSSNDGTITPAITDDGTTLTITVPRGPMGSNDDQLTELSRARDQYKASFEEAGDGMTITDDSARILAVNAEAARIYGEDRQALLGRSMQEFLPSEFDFEAEWGEIQSSKMKRDELDIVSPDGGVSPIEYTAKTDIVPGQHLIVSRDISERKERERVLQATANRLETMVNLSPEPILALDATGAIQLWNNAAAEVFEFEAEAVLGERIHSLDLFNPSQASDFEERLERVLAGETIRNLEVQRQTGDDTTVDLRISAAPLRGEADSVTGLIAVTTDVSEEKARKRELEQTQERYRIVAENFPNGGVFLFDSDMRFQVAAGKGLEDAGLDPAGLEGLHVREALDGEIPSPFIEMCQAALDGESQRKELPFMNRTYQVQTVPVEDTDGAVYAGIAMTQNVTNRRERERFASMVSHDLRNPLNVAQGRLTLARESGEWDHLDHVESALGRIETLIEDVLSLSQSETAVEERELIDLATIVNNCWGSVDTADATFTNRLEGTIRADETRLKQVFENLFGNAYEHGGDGVSVTVGNRDDGFYVEDTGPGIPVSDRSTVFEEGHSSDSDGTGLGLSIVERAVEVHGWDIRVEEGSAGGARFVISGVEYEQP